MKRVSVVLGSDFFGTINTNDFLYFPFLLSSFFRWWIHPHPFLEKERWLDTIHCCWYNHESDGCRSDAAIFIFIFSSLLNSLPQLFFFFILFYFLLHPSPFFSTFHGNIYFTASYRTFTSPSAWKWRWWRGEKGRKSEAYFWWWKIALV